MLTEAAAKFRKGEDWILRSAYVYFVRIGKHIKIGYSRDIDQRLRAFEALSAEVYLQLLIPGDKKLERRLHQLFAQSHINRELFHKSPRILRFMNHCRDHGLDFALNFLAETEPHRIEQKKQEVRAARLEQIRKSRVEKDAYFASIVADRKTRLGW